MCPEQTVTHVSERSLKEISILVWHIGADNLLTPAFLPENVSNL